MNTEHRTQNTGTRLGLNNFLPTLKAKAQKFTFVVLVFLFFPSLIYSQAQPFGTTSASNCYQKVSSGLGTTQTYKFLNTGEGRIITVTNSNPADFISADILYFDALNGWDTLIWDAPSITNYYVDEQYDSVVIKTTLSADAKAFYQVPDIKIIFVEPELNAFDMDKPCLSFNTSRFNFNLNLDGLCNEPEVKISFPTNTSIVNCPNLVNWFALPVRFAPLTIPPCPELCSQIIGDPNTGLQVSPCALFNFDITLFPCLGNPNCPPTTIRLQKEICCWCGTGPGNEN